MKLQIEIEDTLRKPIRELQSGAVDKMPKIERTTRAVRSIREKPDLDRQTGRVSVKRLSRQQPYQPFQVERGSRKQAMLKSLA